MGRHTLTYRVDAQNRILSVVGDWDAFAEENGGPEASAASVIGRDLFEFIADVQTRHIYRQMLDRIRSGSPLRYTYRCDSPDCRRLMEMHVRPTDDGGGVEFQSVTIEEQPRAHIPMPTATTSRVDASDAEHLQLACGWCNRLRVGDDWLELEDAVPLLRLFESDRAPTLSHGICEDCVVQMTAQLEAPSAAL